MMKAKDNKRPAKMGEDCSAASMVNFDSRSSSRFDILLRQSFISNNARMLERWQMPISSRPSQKSQEYIEPSLMQTGCQRLPESMLNREPVWLRTVVRSELSCRMQYQKMMLGHIARRCHHDRRARPLHAESSSFEGSLLMSPISHRSSARSSNSIVIFSDGHPGQLSGCLSI
jgi:hypothetical protein